MTDLRVLINRNELITGLWMDGVLGQKYNDRRLFLTAIESGFVFRESGEDALAIMKILNQEDPDEATEELTEQALQYINELVMPHGRMFIWCDGNLYLIQHSPDTSGKK